MKIDDLIKLGRDARPIDDEEWGSERQTDAANLFYIEVEKVLSKTDFGKLEDYCLHATTDEGIDYALDLLTREPEPATPLAFHIDLKWSLWSEDEDTFDGYRNYGNVLKAMKEAFSGEGPEVKITTSPRKEIRFGEVGMYEGGAHVSFHFEWDDPSDQACRLEDPPELELTEEEHKKAADAIAEWFSEIDWYVDLEVGAKTFPELMRGIDEVESRLLEQEEQYSKAFDAFLEALKTEVMSEREYKKEAHLAGDEDPWEVFQKIQRGEREEDI